MGSIHTGHCLSYTIDKSHNVLVFKTREQLKVLLNTTPEQWITGPAGSGKTWLLMEKVKMLAEKALLHETEEKILVVCYNKPLSMMFLKTFEQHLSNFWLGDKDWSSVVEVMTFDKLLYDITGESDCKKEQQVVNAVEQLERGAAFIKRYDHIFVDECQDLCGDKWPILFKKLQKGSGDNDDGAFPDPKYIWYLYDTNQHLGLSHQQSHFLRRALNITTRLSVVLRNTGNVFNQSKKYFTSEVTGELQLGHREFGKAIEWDDSLTRTEDQGYQGAETIRKHIYYLHKHKVKDRDICVLVRNIQIRNDLRSKLKLLKVETQDAEELLATDENKVTVESIWRFKGLESKVVILYNPPFFEAKDWTVKRTNEVLYTAVSRCFCYLVVITTRFGCQALKSPKGLHESISSACSHPESHKKRPVGDDSDKEEAHISPPKSSRTEAANMHQPYTMNKRYIRECQKKVPGCKLLEPRDPFIEDTIRNKVFSLLDATVEQNLQYVPSFNNMNQPNVVSVIAQIEHEVYRSRRKERNTRNYTRDLRNLKRDIAKCNGSQTTHETVERALKRSVNYYS